MPVEISEIEVEEDAWTREEEHHLDSLQKKKDSETLTEQEQETYGDLYEKRELFYEAGLKALQEGKDPDDSTKTLTTSDEFKVIHQANRSRLAGCLTVTSIISIVVIILAIVFRNATGSDPTFSEFVISTPQGVISGHRSPIESNIVRFLGIPYAKPPVGNLRWRSPAATPDWEGELRASEFRVGCTDATGKGSEDCLYLNIFVPGKVLKNNNTNTAIPVMYWIHGGCYSWGWGTDWGAGSKRYHADHLSRTANAIVVTAEYRLAAFGFLGHPLLRDPTTNTTGNYGIQDQQMVLHWIHRNIASYGGNPNRVMLFGQSAGAGSISIHLVTPSSKGLFSSVALHSGSFSNWIAQPMKAASTNFKTIARSLNCSGSDEMVVRCLQQKSSWQIGSSSNIRQVNCRDGCSWAPVIDGVFQDKYPWKKMAESNTKTVPVLNFQTTDDGFDFVEHVPYFPSPSQWLKWLNTMFRKPSDTNTDAGTAIKLLYKPKNYSSRRDKVANEFFYAASAAETDFAYTCPARRTNKKLVELGGIVFSGVFVNPLSPRSVHSSEIPFLYGNRPGRVSNMMMTYWGNFARNHNPNNEELPKWPMYTLSDRSTLIIGRNVHVQNNYQKEQCDYWDSTWKYFGACVRQPGTEPSPCVTIEGNVCLEEFGVDNKTITACVPRERSKSWCATEVDAAGWPTQYNTCPDSCKTTDKQLKKPRLHQHAYGPTGVNKYLRAHLRHREW